MDQEENSLDNLTQNYGGFTLEFPATLKKCCPNCDRIVNNIETSEQYVNYVKRCNLLFKENAWPVCCDCYHSGIYGVEKCDNCGFPLMNLIYCKSTSGYDVNNTHICNYCTIKERRKKI